MLTATVPAVDSMCAVSKSLWGQMEKNMLFVTERFYCYNRKMKLLLLLVLTYPSTGLVMILLRQIMQSQVFYLFSKQNRRLLFNLLRWKPEQFTWADKSGSKLVYLVHPIPLQKSHLSRKEVLKLMWGHLAVKAVHPLTARPQCVSPGSFR